MFSMNRASAADIWFEIENAAWFFVAEEMDVPDAADVEPGGRPLPSLPLRLLL